MASTISFEVTLVSLNNPPDEYPERRFTVKSGLTAFENKDSKEPVIEGFGIGRSSRHSNNHFYTAARSTAWINSPVVSRTHAVFNVKDHPPRLTIMDVKATHGVYVNGKLLHPREPCEIQDGDTIQLGETVNRVTNDGIKESWDPRSFRVYYQRNDVDLSADAVQLSHLPPFEKSKVYSAPNFDTEDEFDHDSMLDDRSDALSVRGSYGDKTDDLVEEEEDDLSQDGYKYRRHQVIEDSMAQEYGTPDTDLEDSDSEGPQSPRQKHWSDVEEDTDTESLQHDSEEDGDYEVDSEMGEICDQSIGGEHDEPPREPPVEVSQSSKPENGRLPGINSNTTFDTDKPQLPTPAIISGMNLSLKQSVPSMIDRSSAQALETRMPSEFRTPTNAAYLASNTATTPSPEPASPFKPFLKPTTCDHSFATEAAPPQKMSLHSILEPRNQASFDYGVSPLYPPPSPYEFNFTSAYAGLAPYPRSPNEEAFDFPEHVNNWHDPAGPSNKAYNQGPFQPPQENRQKSAPGESISDMSFRRFGMSIEDLVEEDRQVQFDPIGVARPFSPKRKAVAVEDDSQSLKLAPILSATAEENVVPVQTNEDALDSVVKTTTANAPDAGAGDDTPHSSSTQPEKKQKTGTESSSPMEVQLEPAQINLAKAAAQSIVRRKTSKRSRVQGIKSTALTAALGMFAGGVAVFSALALSPEEWFL